MEGSRSSKEPMPEAGGKRVSSRPPRANGAKAKIWGVKKAEGERKPVESRSSIISPSNATAVWDKILRKNEGMGTLPPDAVEGTPIMVSTNGSGAGTAPAIIRKYSSEVERTMALIPAGVRHRIEQALEKSRDKFDPAAVRPCPFTDSEIDELAHFRDPEDFSKPREMLVFLPKNLAPDALCGMWGIKSNMNFANDGLVNVTMKDVDQWFITSTSRIPEFLSKSGDWIIDFYKGKMNGEQRLHGMDIRRYLMFCGFHFEHFGRFPDQGYWNFLWATAYDRSGILVSGFDRFGVLSSHGWMKNWSSKFSGSRYVVLPPRDEVHPETEKIERVYRYDDKGRNAGRRADGDLENAGLAERAQR